MSRFQTTDEVCLSRASSLKELLPSNIRHSRMGRVIIRDDGRLNLSMRESRFGKSRFGRAVVRKMYFDRFAQKPCSKGSWQSPVDPKIQALDDLLEAKIVDPEISGCEIFDADVDLVHVPMAKCTAKSILWVPQNVRRSILGRSLSEGNLAIKFPPNVKNSRVGRVMFRVNEESNVSLDCPSNGLQFPSNIRNSRFGRSIRVDRDFIHLDFRPYNSHRSLMASRD